MAASGAACAACKYQRRRCTPECQLAEYFPQDQPRVFRNAHRLFGVSNILKTLERVGPERRRDAMRTIVFEANAWEAYPAHGCVPIIRELHHHVLQTELQLQQVKESIKAYQQQLIISEEDDSSSLLLQAPWTMQPPAQNDMDMASAAAVNSSYYFLDEEMPAPPESSTDSSSEKKAMKEPNMKGVFTLTSGASNLN